MIYLVLHGETQWNRQRRFQGRLDSPLTPDGLEQARRVGTKLAGLIEDAASCAVVSSPLGRARQTAELICKAFGIATERVSLDPRLMEIDLGSRSGLLRDDMSNSGRAPSKAPAAMIGTSDHPMASTSIWPRRAFANG